MIPEAPTVGREVLPLVSSFDHLGIGQPVIKSGQPEHSDQHEDDEDGEDEDDKPLADPSVPK